MSKGKPDTVAGKNDNGSEHAARRDLMIQGRAGYMSHDDGAFKIKYGTG